MMINWTLWKQTESTEDDGYNWLQGPVEYVKI